ncbi:hypothetical protein [Actinomadura kijaniata]|uniref:hypothetical protein n=1 Tax=Actinomadura kijaniata TaxID=46161 RepID=UPI00083768D8|nr:hypothetical protein [Actinomadura kijaniata]
MADQPDKEENKVQAAPEKPEVLVPLGTKVRESTRKRLRIYAVQEEIEMQEVVDHALDAFLRERGY